MERLTFNQEAVVLDEQLNEHERINVTPEFIIYNQFLNQLHLPFEKWAYEKEVRGVVLVEKHAEMEELDTFIFKELDYTRLVSPLHLYSYYLLQLFLGNALNFNGIGVLRERKSHFVFLDTAFEISNMIEPNFKLNNLGRFLLKRGRKEELLITHETFFVLLDQKFKSKILNALTLYQSETGVNIDKLNMIDAVLNQRRLEKLKAFSLKQIELL